MEDQNQQPTSSEETTTEKTSPEVTSTEPTTPSEAPAAATSQDSAPTEPVTEAPAPAPAPIVAPAPAPAPAPTTVVAAPKVVTPVAAAVKPAPVAEFPKVTGFAEVDRLLVNVPAANQTGLLRLMDYIETMNPKRPMDEKTGARAQAMLFKVLQNTINREDVHFRQIFSAILALFEVEPTGVFKEVNLFRFMDQVELSQTDRKAFERILNLIKVMGPKKSRAQAIKQVSFENSLRYGLTEQGRQRVLDFFNVGV